MVTLLIGRKGSGKTKKLIAQGKTVTVIMGFGSADEVFYKEEFEALGVKVYSDPFRGTGALSRGDGRSAAGIVFPDQWTKN